MNPIVLESRSLGAPTSWVVRTPTSSHSLCVSGLVAPEPPTLKVSKSWTRNLIASGFQSPKSPRVSGSRSLKHSESRGPSSRCPQECPNSISRTLQGEATVSQEHSASAPRIPHECYMGIAYVHSKRIPGVLHAYPRRTEVVPTEYHGETSIAHPGALRVLH